MTPTRASTVVITCGRAVTRLTPSSNPTSSPGPARNSASPPTGCTASPHTSIAARSLFRPRPLRLDQAPAGVVSHRVARLAVAVEKVEWHALVGDLERAIGSGGGPPVALHNRTAPRCRPLSRG